jgi:DNA-binding NtrC family response regulator
VNVVTIPMPSLRDRTGDIALLAGHFLRRHCKEIGREVLGFTETAMSTMQRYAWPGNVRELENAIERAVVLCRRPQIDLDDLPETVHLLQGSLQAAGSRDKSHAMNGEDGGEFASPMPLEAALEGPERLIIESALRRNNWNRQATAAELDINRTTLYKKMRKYRLDVGETN